ncbi:MAG: sugar phosphate isomerase/epimerase [Clostridia bacterium]|nr:sugar phosphate isomerase/epimerase [Clostridia bacterium]
MKFGFCVGDDRERVAVAAAVGADYVETGFDTLAREDGARYDAFAEALASHGIRCESANCFLPGSLKVTGDTVDYDALKRYVARGMSRGEAVGLKTVVFGSGGARNVPEGFPFCEAFRQLTFFLREIAGPLAEQHGVNVVVEPLWDSNIINTAKEGAMLAAAANRPNVFGLVDLFHMYKMSDRIDNIRDLKGALMHAHIAEPSQRKYPLSAEEYDYKAFIDALEFSGCPRCSVEAGCNDFAGEAPVTMKLLRNL